MDLGELVDTLFKAHQNYDKLIFDEKYEGQLGKPAQNHDIQTLEKTIGFTLPRDYREFLLRHDGWTAFDGEGKLLSVKDHSSDWVADIIAEWSDIWESEDPNPFAQGAVPVMLGEDIENFLVLNPTKKNENGEPVFELYDAMELDDSFQTFTGYLSEELKTLQEMIHEERDGVDEAGD